MNPYISRVEVLPDHQMRLWLKTGRKGDGGILLIRNVTVENNFQAVYSLLAAFALFALSAVAVPHVSADAYSTKLVPGYVIQGAGGSSATVMISVPADPAEAERNRKEDAEYDARRATLYQSDAVEDRVLRVLGDLLICGNIFPDELNPGNKVLQKNSRERLKERAELSLSDEELDSLLLKLLKHENTLTLRQVEDIFEILGQGGEKSWKSIAAAARQLERIETSVIRNLPPRSRNENAYDDLARRVFHLGHSRLQSLLKGGVAADKLHDDISFGVLDSLSVDPRLESSGVGAEIRKFVSAVRNADVSEIL